MAILCPQTNSASSLKPNAMFVFVFAVSNQFTQETESNWMNVTFVSGYFSFFNDYITQFKAYLVMMYSFVIK